MTSAGKGRIERRLAACHRLTGLVQVWSKGRTGYAGLGSCSTEAAGSAARLTSASPRNLTSGPNKKLVATGHVWTAPAVQEEFDLSAKRSGAAMYAACFSRRGLPRRDAAAVAAGPDVIR